MQPLAELDLRKVLEEKGFVDVVIEPFSETVDADLAAMKAWRFPWTYISARKPAQKFGRNRDRQQPGLSTACID